MRISRARHAVVAGAVGATTALAGFGVIGAGDHPERYETWQTVIQPAGDDGVRIVETFDQDFGSEERRGHQRFVPNDAGVPTDVVASSPDAPDDVTVDVLGSETRIRIGDPAVTISGQHRYRLAYTLPAARTSSGRLVIDVLDGDEFETLSAEVVITGFELADPQCFVGEVGSTDRCELRQEGDGLYRATLGQLAPFTGVTVEAEIVGTAPLASVDPPPLPERRDDDRLPLTLGMAGIGLAGAAPVYAWARRKGRNEVFAGGAADAAYGALPAPGSVAPDAPPPPVTLVADDDLGDLATIEFVPPKGLEPWEAAVLLNEKIDDRSVEAWVSGLAGREVIELGERDGKLTIGAGAKRAAASDRDSALIARLQGGKNPYVTGTYDAAFAAAWRAVAEMQRERIAAAGWWKHFGPGERVSLGGGGGSAFRLLVFVGFGLVWFGNVALAGLGLLRSWPLALAVGLLFPATVAYFVYRAMLPARSAQGSALALRTESFRRFLHASEAQHVEWAWSKGLLREYSGWAVALGEADAWGDALSKADVPAPARASRGPLIVAGRRSSINASRTKPSSSGSSGSGRSGGFRGGRVGGGGGGGRRGSW
jgi:hypothetical protein